MGSLLDFCLVQASFGLNLILFIKGESTLYTVSPNVMQNMLRKRMEMNNLFWCELPCGFWRPCKGQKDFKTSNSYDNLQTIQAPESNNVQERDHQTEQKRGHHFLLLAAGISARSRETELHSKAELSYSCRVRTEKYSRRIFLVCPRIFFKVCTI